MLIESLGLIARDAARTGVLYGASAILLAVGYLAVCDRREHAPDGSVC